MRAHCYNFNVKNVADSLLPSWDGVKASQRGLKRAQKAEMNLKTYNHNGTGASFNH